LNPRPTDLETVALPVELHSCINTGLFGFFIQHMLANKRVILTQFQPGCGRTAVLECVIHMTAFRTLHLDQNAIAFFRHLSPSITKPLLAALLLFYKPSMGLEPMAFPLPRECSTTELRRRITICYRWAEEDSNLRRLPPADLQSAPFAARDTDPC
jgi:hypothetical protein